MVQFPHGEFFLLKRKYIDIARLHHSLHLLGWFQEGNGNFSIPYYYEFFILFLSLCFGERGIDSSLI